MGIQIIKEVSEVRTQVCAHVCVCMFIYLCVFMHGIWNMHQFSKKYLQQSLCKSWVYGNAAAVTGGHFFSLDIPMQSFIKYVWHVSNPYFWIFLPPDHTWRLWKYAFFYVLFIFSLSLWFNRWKPTHNISFCIHTIFILLKHLLLFYLLST